MNDPKDAKKKGPFSRERDVDRMNENRPLSDPRRSSAALDEARLRQQAIGVRLRQMFDEVVNEPVPDEFFDILRSADERSTEQG